MPPGSLEQLEDRCAKGKGSWAPSRRKQGWTLRTTKAGRPKPESESNGQRTNKETAAQVIRDVAERQSQAFDHKSAFRDVLSDGIFHRIRSFPGSRCLSLLSECARRANSSTADLYLLQDPVGRCKTLQEAERLVTNLHRISHSACTTTNGNFCRIRVKIERIHYAQIELTCYTRNVDIRWRIEPPNTVTYGP